MRNVIAFAVTLALLALSSTQCRNEPATSASGSAGIDRSRLCKDGGADLDERTNACVCPDAAKWDGFKCVAAGGDQPSAASMTDAENANAPATERDLEAKAAKEAKALADKLSEGATPLPAADKDVADSDVAKDDGKSVTADAKTSGGAGAVAAACRRARGVWLEKEAYCHCPDGKVLVGSTCRTLPGVVTDDACTRAVHKGRWVKGHCLCGEGQVFSPSRGGCVAPLTGESATMGRRVCESSMNRGRWDARGVRCDCPEGRIWIGEACEVKGNLTSREICESDYQGGKWDPTRRRCACPARRSPDGSGGMQMWIDQACRPAATVSEPTACVAESNGGRWNAALKTCVCPGGDKWDAAARTCG
jgi:hypothetical protein